jgi:hypothetical protein
MIISVFKTSTRKKDIINLSPVLNNLGGLSKWNTDLEDCDNILRVESHSDIVEDIINILSKQGLQCEELED